MNLADQQRSPGASNNHVAPILILPEEILTKIFMIILVESDPSNSSDLVPVTRVCREWRQFSIGYPQLWTQIRIERFSSIIPFFFQWSLDLPISLVATHLGSSAQYYSTEFISFVKCSHHRIRELEIVGLPDFVDPIMGSLLSPASIMESAKISIVGDRGSLNVHLPPPNLFNGHAPHLRKFSLQGVAVKWNSPMLLGLTHLCVEEGPDPLAVLSTLKKMAHLHTLQMKLRGGTDALSLDPLNPTHIVDLPHLRDLRVEGTLLSCITFVERLQYPPSTRLCISAISQREDSPSWMNFIRKHPCESSHSLDIKYYGQVLEINTSSVEFCLARVSPSAVIPLLAVGVGAFAHVTGATHLRFDFKSHILPYSDWVALFSGADNLTHISITVYDDALPFFKFFSLIQKRASEGVFILPLLQRIESTIRNPYWPCDHIGLLKDLISRASREQRVAMSLLRVLIVGGIVGERPHEKSIQWHIDTLFDMD